MTNLMDIIPPGQPPEEMTDEHLVLAYQAWRDTSGPHGQNVFQQCENEIIRRFRQRAGVPPRASPDHPLNQ